MDGKRELPSGQQFQIQHGDQQATVVEVGGGLRTYSAGDQEMLDGYPEEQMCAGSRGMLLAPWPNRLEDGRYEFEGGNLQLPLSEPEKRNAIHGLVRWMNWGLAQRDERSVRLELLLHPQPGYPFSLSLEVEYGLSREGLQVTVTAENRGAHPLPYGVGHHPYLSVRRGLVDDARLEVPAKSRLELTERGIPTGRRFPVAGSPLDFREPRQIGPACLDTAFTDLVPDSDGIVRTKLQPAGHERHVSLWMDGSYRWLMVFTGDTLKDVSRRRRGLAVEPMTCPPNAFRSGEGMRVLAPGASFRSRWGITPG